VSKIIENLLGSRLQIHEADAVGLLRQGRGGPNRQYGYAPIETDLITEEWPSHGYPQDSTSRIKSKIREFVMNITVSTEVLNLINANNEMLKAQPYIINQLRSAFSYRFANFYGTYSAAYPINKLLRKVEVASSLLLEVKGFPSLCKSLAIQQLQGARFMWSNPCINYGKVDLRTLIQEYLFERRSLMYPEITILPVIEPEAGSFLTPDVGNGWFVESGVGPGCGGQIVYFPEITVQLNSSMLLVRRIRYCSPYLALMYAAQSLVL
jgi:hypothetical protein